MKFEALKEFISKKLSTELAPELMYHSFDHTMEVYRAAQRYAEEEADRICNMILATRIPQLPKTHLEEIMCDADLDYLGRNDYTQIADGLYEEMRMAGQIKTEKDWI